MGKREAANVDWEGRVPKREIPGGREGGQPTPIKEQLKRDELPALHAGGHFEGRGGVAERGEYRPYHGGTED